MNFDKIVLLDFGGRNTLSVARRIRETKVYSEVFPWNKSSEEWMTGAVRGVILIGDHKPDGNMDDYVRDFDQSIWELGVPILGVAFGATFMAYSRGGKIRYTESEPNSETVVTLDMDHPLFTSIKAFPSVCINKHSIIDELPEGFKRIASAPHYGIVAMANDDEQQYAIQFEPESQLTEEGFEILNNFVKDICGGSNSWSTDLMIDISVSSIKAGLEGKRVICALSGGVDSTVSAVLVQRAVGAQLTCIFVNHGLLRKNEAEEVLEVYKRLGLKVILVDARARFLEALRGITDPEEKRKIIGDLFIRIFEEEAIKRGGAEFLVQGTIYSDVIESGGGNADFVKSHHNVGGLPEKIDFEGVLEPLRMLFKDEVRELGYKLGIPAEILERQPFPGPGLAIRVIGDVTEEKLSILRESDAILRNEIKLAGLEKSIWQYFTVFLPIKTVGVKNGKRTYAYTVAIRAITSIDAMEADVAELPYDLLNRISNKIINEVKNVNRVVYDVTQKPPGTIEWE